MIKKLQEWLFNRKPDITEFNAYNKNYLGQGYLEFELLNLIFSALEVGTLKSLSLDFCHLSEESLNRIGNKLKENNHLHTINIPNNEAGYYGTHAICNNTTSLTKINLSKNGISASSAEDIITLIGNNKLQIFNISQNPIGGGMNNIINSLFESASNLMYVNLSNTNTNNIGKQKILNFIFYNTNALKSISCDNDNDDYKIDDYLKINIGDYSCNNIINFKDQDIYIKYLGDIVKQDGDY